MGKTPFLSFRGILSALVLGGLRNLAEPVFSREIVLLNCYYYVKTTDSPFFFSLSAVA
jgi:hypothetical protein